MRAKSLAKIVKQDDVLQVKQKYSFVNIIIKKVTLSLQRNLALPHCVMVAQQILVLYVRVRVLVGQQSKGKLIFG